MNLLGIEGIACLIEFRRRSTTTASGKLAITRSRASLAGCAIHYSVKILFVPLSQVIVMSPPFGVTARPVAVSILAINLSESEAEASSSQMMRFSLTLPETADNVTSEASAVPSEIGRAHV